LDDAGMERDAEMQAFVVAYEQAWASRVPGVMGEMWHPDGVLHHPALGKPITGEVVPYNNDFTKSAIPDFSWALTRWASAGDVAFLEWRCQGRVGGEMTEWRGVDVMVIHEGKVAEERVYMDTYPLRRQLDGSLPDEPLVDPTSLGPS
jgi:hypothetical protein